MSVLYHEVENLEEFINECSSREIDELVNILKDSGYLNGFTKNKTILDLEWDEAIFKLAKSRHSLSLIDEETIIKITNKL